MTILNSVCLGRRQTLIVIGLIGHSYLTTLSLRGVSGSRKEN